MSIRFETCDRRMALGFLQKLYPAHEITDTPESAGPMLDMVQQDIFRVPDPDFHSGGEIYPSKNWKDEHMDDAQRSLRILDSSPEKGQKKERYTDQELIDLGKLEKTPEGHLRTPEKAE